MQSGLRPVMAPVEAEASEPAPFFQIDFELAIAIRALATRGALGGFVRPADIAPSRLRRLRELGVVELLDGTRGLEARFTAAGDAALKRALKVIVAGPGRGA